MSADTGPRTAAKGNKIFFQVGTIFSVEPSVRHKGIGFVEDGSVKMDVPEGHADWRSCRDNIVTVACGRGGIDVGHAVGFFAET